MGMFEKLQLSEATIANIEWEITLDLAFCAFSAKGLHLHPCFSKAQPFIFVATRRKPTGYWFVDYMRGRIYWSSSTVPGGYGRLCRRVG